MKTSIAITPRPISVSKIVRSVEERSAGGTVVFIGTVRNNSGGKKVSMLEFEAADDLAKADLKRIGESACRRFGLLRVAISHRKGRLKVGDVIIVIAVSSAHRQDAFKGCRYIIDELKRTTPIWKKEHSGGKSRWVNG